MLPVTEEEHRQALAVGSRRAELSLQELWLRYFTVGGTADLVELEAFLHGLLPLPALQRDMLAHAINERLDELKVPYCHPGGGQGGGEEKLP